MKITLLTVGKIKESYLREAIAEYTKRIGKYGRIDVVEVQDEKTPDGASAAIEQQIKEIEGKRLLSKIPEGSYVITLEILGKMLDSVELSDKLAKLTVQGVSHVCFIIGGSLGLSPEVLRRSDFGLSFSKMTFPHQLMRVILLEQIYRAYRIQNHEPYHK